MLEYGRSAASRGLSVIIAGAGGAAHLPGMLAAVTPLPVIGVPVPLKYLDGMDSLLSIVQMPAGVPVATVAIGGARNAGLLAVRILGATDPELQERMTAFQAELKTTAQEKGAAVRNDAPRGGSASRRMPVAPPAAGCGASGSSEVGLAVGAAPEEGGGSEALVGPAAVGLVAVVAAAQGGEVEGVGLADRPFDDVVEVAASGWSFAVGEDAGGVGLDDLLFEPGGGFVGVGVTGAR